MSFYLNKSLEKSEKTQFKASIHIFYLLNTEVKNIPMKMITLSVQYHV